MQLNKNVSILSLEENSLTKKKKKYSNFILLVSLEKNERENKQYKLDINILFPR